LDWSGAYSTGLTIPLTRQSIQEEEEEAILTFAGRQYFGSQQEMFLSMITESGSEKFCLCIQKENMLKAYM
jgi:hypothetical protein